MRLILFFILAPFFIINTQGQSDGNAERILIYYQSSFAVLPEIYEINLTDRRIEKISPIREFPENTQKRFSRKVGKSKWKKIINSIETTNFYTLSSSEGQGIDGAWYTIKIYGESGITKLKIWSGYAPESLIELHNTIKKIFKNK